MPESLHQRLSGISWYSRFLHVSPWKTIDMIKEYQIHSWYVYDTVDTVVGLTIYSYRVFLRPRWCRISSINSMFPFWGCFWCSIFSPTQNWVLWIAGSGIRFGSPAKVWKKEDLSWFVEREWLHDILSYSLSYPVSKCWGFVCYCPIG